MFWLSHLHSCQITPCAFIIPLAMFSNSYYEELNFWGVAKGQETLRDILLCSYNKLLWIAAQKSSCFIFKLVIVNLEYLATELVSMGTVWKTKSRFFFLFLSPFFFSIYLILFSIQPRVLVFFHVVLLEGSHPIFLNPIQTPNNAVFRKGYF